MTVAKRATATAPAAPSPGMAPPAAELFLLLVAAATAELILADLAEVAAEAALAVILEMAALADDRTLDVAAATPVVAVEFPS